MTNNHSIGRAFTIVFLKGNQNITEQLSEEQIDVYNSIFKGNHNSHLYNIVISIDVYNSIFQEYYNKLTSVIPTAGIRYLQ